jgi:SecD/SecF fusion protein
MFCALLITRVLFRWGQDSGTIKKLSFLSIIPTNANFDFLGKRKIAATVSLSLLFVAVAAFGLKRDASLGIDFTGGSRISFQIGENEKVPEQSAYDAIDDLKLTKKPIVQEESSPASGELLTIRCATEDAPKIIGELRKDIHLFGQHNIAFELGQDAAVTELAFGVTLYLSVDTSELFNLGYFFNSHAAAANQRTQSQMKYRI